MNKVGKKLEKWNLISLNNKARETTEENSEPTDGPWTHGHTDGLTTVIYSILRLLRSNKNKLHVSINGEIKTRRILSGTE